MQTKNEELMRVESSEEWEVTIGKEKFSLNEKQIAVLKEADSQGMRGIIWFDGFAISIPHIQHIKYKGMSGHQPSPPVPEFDDIPEEERLANLEKLREIRNAIH